MSSIATHTTCPCCATCITNTRYIPVDTIPASLTMLLEHELVARRKVAVAPWSLGYRAQYWRLPRWRRSARGRSSIPRDHLCTFLAPAGWTALLGQRANFLQGHALHSLPEMRSLRDHGVNSYFNSLNCPSGVYYIVARLLQLLLSEWFGNYTKLGPH
jgi:hypothetical protein